jgi:hypothetical protein
MRGQVHLLAAKPFPAGVDQILRIEVKSTCVR